LSGRERRFQSWLNHNVSKRIVEIAKASQVTIALEDLTGIRERTNQQLRRKTERRRSNTWAFHQLRLFIEYKALGAGVKVEVINPRCTSQTCHKCLHIHPDPESLIGVANGSNVVIVAGMAMLISTVQRTFKQPGYL